MARFCKNANVPYRIFMSQPNKKDFRLNTMVLMISLLLAVAAFPNGFYSPNLSAATTAVQFLPFADTYVTSEAAPLNFGSNAAVRFGSGSILGTAFMKNNQPSLANNLMAEAITAAIETDPVPHSRDAADDPLVWIHPTDPSLSTVMGNDKQGAYEVDDIRTGDRLQSIEVDVRNTDIRYNFPLGGQTVTLVTGYSATRKGLIAWKVNPSTRMLEDVTETGSSVKSGGGAMYHSPVTGEFYWFSNSSGTLYQYRLSDNGSGRVAATLVRTVSYGARTNSKGEATVADDVHGYVYISEETVGMWRLNAEPEGGSTKTMVDKPVSQGGHFTPELEGLAIYYKSDGTGYLFASSQGSDSYNIYQREGNNAYIGSFSIEDGVVDGTSSTDGIEVINFPMGSQYPYGVFIAQDGANFDGEKKENQNFKIVPFERIAQQFGLTMDIQWDPRAVGR
jgi:3-phytase